MPEKTADLVATSYKYDIGVFVRLALVTGLNINEINSLRWDSFEYDLSSDHECYNLYVSEVRYNLPYLILTPHTERRTSFSRRLCLPVKTGRELLQWCELHTIRNTPYMLVEEDDEITPVYRLSAQYAQIMQLMTEAHVKNLEFDALRNTFVINALVAGLSADVIELILGLQPSYQLSAAEAAQIQQKFACGFPASLIDVFPTVDYTPIDPEL